MFFKKIKNSLAILLICTMIFPINVLAYSDYILAGGDNIGIELNSNGIIVVGTYKIKNENPAKEAGLKTGDVIISINDTKVNTINELLNVISKNNNSSNTIKVTYLRGSNRYNTNLKLVSDDNNTYKTGIYVKDSINGIGTLTFIDPNTKLYGALGHEILEKTTGQRVEVSKGKIYESSVTGITKSNTGTPGEKNARYNSQKVFGKINENTKSGIFGEYTAKLPNKKLYKVAKPSEIKLGKANLLTVLKDNKIDSYEIQILQISREDQATKNILFEITDPTLLEKTGGIVQGMSGSPIIQDDNIIGAVTHVVVDNPKEGYGIFITNMLEEAEN